MVLMLILYAFMHHAKVFLVAIGGVEDVCVVSISVMRPHLIYQTISGEVVFLVFQNRRQVGVLVNRKLRLLW